MKVPVHHKKFLLVILLYEFASDRTKLGHRNPVLLYSCQRHSYFIVVGLLAVKLLILQFPTDSQKKVNR
jgi:hypothetical protein